MFIFASACRACLLCYMLLLVTPNNVQEVVRRFGGGVRGQFRLHVPGVQRPPSPPPGPPSMGVRLCADAAFGDDAGGGEDRAPAEAMSHPAMVADDWEDAVVDDAPAVVSRRRVDDEGVVGGQWALLARLFPID